MENLPDIIEMPVLLKISKVKYLQEIQAGNLYMNNLKYYVDLEKETQQQGIGDIREASLGNIKRHELFIQVGEKEKKKVPINPSPGIIYDMEAIYYPVFCLMGKTIFLKRETAHNTLENWLLVKRKLGILLKIKTDMEY